MSYPEVLLWQRLRGRAMGARFRRGHPIGPYVADFYCASAKLVVEVDGEVHAQPCEKAHDRSRDRFLKDNGYCVIRIAAADILRDADAAAEAVGALAARPLHRPADGPQCWVDHAPGMILDCRGQSNPTLRAREDRA